MSTDLDEVRAKIEVAKSALRFAMAALDKAGRAMSQPKTFQQQLAEYERRKAAQGTGT